METLINFYHSMPGLVQFIMDFFFTVIIMRGIVANELLKEGRKIWAWFKSDRIKAIRRHYWERAKGNGHQNDNVLDCSQDLCQVF